MIKKIKFAEQKKQIENFIQRLQTIEMGFLFGRFVTFSIEGCTIWICTVLH